MDAPHSLFFRLAYAFQRKLLYSIVVVSTHFRSALHGTTPEGSPSLRAFNGLLSVLASRRALTGEQLAAELENALTNVGVLRGARKGVFDTIPVSSTRVPNKTVWTVGHGADPATVKNVILYAHGGGYLGGSSYAYEHFCGTLAHKCNAKVLVVDYTLAGKVPIREQQNELLESYQYLIQDLGINASDIIIAGDSAGGGHALGLLRRIVQSELPKPAAGLLFSPWADLDCSENYTNNASAKDPTFIYDSTFPKMGVAASKLSGKPPSDPENSMIHGTYKGLPDLCIMTGRRERLLADTERIAELAREAGVNVSVDIADNCPHDFPHFSLLVNAPELKQGLERSCTFLKQVFSNAKSS